MGKQFTEEKKKVYKENQLKKRQQSAKAKAKIAQQMIKKGRHKKIHKVRTSLRFHRPQTQKLARKPKYARTIQAALPQYNGFDKYKVILSPIATEKAMKKMEEENTMVFLVHPGANKHQIKEAFKSLYNVKVRSVNTMIRYLTIILKLQFLQRPDGKKKAYIKLVPSDDSLNLANKIGII